MELSEPWGGHRLALLFWLVFHPFPTHGQTLLDALRRCSAFARSLTAQVLRGCDVFLAAPMAPSFSSKRRWVFPSSLLIQHLLLASIRAPGASLVVIASPSGRMVPGVRTKAGSSFHLLCLPWCRVKGVSLFAGSKKDPHSPSCTITKWRFCHQKVQQFFIKQPVTELLLCCFTLNFFVFENFQTGRTFAVTMQ